ncbi:AAA family ATPase [Paenibacillus xylanexedens]|uniref:nSTAND3 domain-containing NTPase n=1 Tax=Paenibacillus xylanexedens TaxID=528191 RepID=UPI000FBE175C|nr:AAA family ATPase [Paenibacillus xylanexedens]RPK29496.1 hypothetical protein EDO6_00119 [Paenibacillus xylanexedens]
MLEKNKTIQKGDNNFSMMDSTINCTINVSEESKSNSDFGLEKFSEYLDEDFQDFFFKTKYYSTVMKSFEENSVVILIGTPGIGKTYTSKKVCFDYESQGYHILYSENVNENEQVGLINKFVSEDSKRNIFILLDDFLGLVYSAIKDGKNEEISKLIKKVKKEKNRIKMLINSRGPVYNAFKSSERTAQTIDSSRIDEIMFKDLEIEDRANIFYNHLKKSYVTNTISAKHYCALLNEREYLKVIINNKFNPRVIEYVTSNSKEMSVEGVTPENYFDYIISNLENPEKIWDKEIKNLEKNDRIFIYTLFSLTKTNVNINVLRECFDRRIEEDNKNNSNFDTTISQFEIVSNRLLNSLIKIDGPSEKVGVLNPSINDWLYKNLMSNRMEIEKIITSSLYFEQIECFDSTKYFQEPFIELIKNGKLPSMKTFSKSTFEGFPEHATPKYLYLLKMLLWKLDEEDLAKAGLDNDQIQNYIEKMFVLENYNLIEAEARLYNSLKSSELFCKLFSEPLINKYNLTQVITDEKYLEVILNSIARDKNYFYILSNIYSKYKKYFEDKFYKLNQVKSASINNIVTYIINEIYDELVSEIECSASNIIDEYEGEPFDDFVEAIYEDICDNVLNDMIDNVISKKLYKENIEWLDVSDFDIDGIISDEIELEDLIRDKCSKYYQSEDGSEYHDNKSREEEINNVIELFENLKNFLS